MAWTYNQSTGSLFQGEGAATKAGRGFSGPSRPEAMPTGHYKMETALVGGRIVLTPGPGTAIGRRGTFSIRVGGMADMLHSDTDLEGGYKHMPLVFGPLPFSGDRPLKPATVRSIESQVSRPSEMSTVIWVDPVMFLLIRDSMAAGHSHLNVVS